MKIKSIRVSVRELVSFSIGGGDISSGGMPSSFSEAEDGTSMHVEFQKNMKLEHKEAFTSEAYVKDIIKRDDLELTVSGRADGLLETAGGGITVYEVKTTMKMPEDIKEEGNPEHWGQAECYAHLISRERGTTGEIAIRLVYINRETGEKKLLEKTYGAEKLKSIYEDFIFSYVEWMSRVRDWEVLRNKSIKNLSFPFNGYRPGQRKMAGGVYRALKDRERLFVQAPTGTGKTMAALFPAVKALGEGEIDRIFYLTAKTVTSRIAAENYKKMCERGLNLRAVMITAKDKVCPMDKRICDPDYCDRAKGYYYRSKDAVADLLSDQFLDRDAIRICSDRHNVCPFELSLDASLYCDVIICDYNYLFDPRVRLIRFFQEIKEEYGFLIDEAHNLVDRGREMFSCELSQSSITRLEEATPSGWDDVKRRLSDLAGEIGFLEEEKLVDNGREAAAASEDLPVALAEKALKCSAVMEGRFDEDMEGEYETAFTDMYFNLLFFGKIASLFDERFNTFYMRSRDDIKVKLMCLDPSKLLSQAMDAGKGIALFSATLEPMEYYKNLLGAREFDPGMTLPSPFPEENLLVAVEARISTKYRNRHLTYGDIAFLLRDAFESKVGNYIAFFPSYRYMDEVLKIYETISGNTEILVQNPGMDESQREEFLDRFERHGDRTLAAFAVMGGIFGEGVDLAGERLSGTVVIGTGLPAVCPERELIRRYYDETNGRGFDYAYTYPGLNRVLQAAGRVIRSESDKGFVILVDGRFAGYKYKRLFPAWWRPRYFTGGDESIAGYIT